jgi:16S rRNA (guanine527-N7)-methyltransferase
VVSDALITVLAEAQRLGFIGPVDIRLHVEHAQGFLTAAGIAPPPTRVVDLGSGGGLPALVLAEAWVDAELWLIEANQRRVQFLAEVVVELGWASRVTVLNGRAETVGRQEDLRATMDLVTARGFGPPAVTAECAAPFLEIGGRLVVSEPPDQGRADDLRRWPQSGLSQLGLAMVATTPTPGAHFALLRQDAPCPDRYPRRVGIPRKRPLF